MRDLLAEQSRCSFISPHRRWCVALIDQALQELLAVRLQPVRCDLNCSGLLNCKWHGRSSIGWREQCLMPARSQAIVPATISVRNMWTESMTLTCGTSDVAAR